MCPLALPARRVPAGSSIGHGQPSRTRIKGLHCPLVAYVAWSRVSRYAQTYRAPLRPFVCCKAWDRTVSVSFCTRAPRADLDPVVGATRQVTTMKRPLLQTSPYQPWSSARRALHIRKPSNSSDQPVQSAHESLTWPGLYSTRAAPRRKIEACAHMCCPQAFSSVDLLQRTR